MLCGNNCKPVKLLVGTTVLVKLWGNQNHLREKTAKHTWPGIHFLSFADGLEATSWQQLLGSLAFAGFWLGAHLLFGREVWRQTGRKILRSQGKSAVKRYRRIWALKWWSMCVYYHTDWGKMANLQLRRGQFCHYSKNISIRIICWSLIY